MLAPFLAFLNRHARLILAGGIFAGLALPGLAALLRPLVEAAVVASLSLSLLRIDWPTVVAWGRRPLRAAAGLGWILLGAPVLTLAAVTLLDLPPGLAVALVFAAAAPPVTAAPAFALLLGLDAALALVLLVAGTAILPLSLGAVAFWLLDLELSIGLGPFLLRVALYIALPFVISEATRRFVHRDWLDARAMDINGLIVLALVVFAIAIMDGVTARLLADPWTVAGFTAAAFILNLVLQAIGAAAFFWLGWRGALTMGLASGYRNMAIMLVLTAGMAGPDMWLYVAIAQFPIFVMPMLTNPIYRRLLPAGTV
jgi:BASS family bile acid:Na+ symporter